MIDRIPDAQDTPSSPQLPSWLCHLYDGLIASVLLVVAYVLRATAPMSVVSWDEPAWVLRSTRFLLGLRCGDLAQTLQTGHPGVITMWAGALSLNWHRLVTGRVTLQALQSAARIEFPAQLHDAAALRELDALLPYAKPGVWLANALVVVGVYLLLSRLLTRRTAAVAGLALALSPYYTALGRLLHLDALVAGAMLLSLLAAMLYEEQGRRAALLLSGALAALAALTRSVGLFMVPVALGVILWAWLRRPERRALALLAAMGLWAAGFSAAFTLSWPALWVVPLRAIMALFSLSVEYAAVEPGATATFFRGRVVEEPGLLFYPVATWFRLTPFAVLLGGLAVVAAPVRLPLPHDGARRRLTLALAAFALLLLVVLSLAAKKFDRYALPALLAADLLGAIGLSLALDVLAERLLKPGVLKIVWRSLIVTVGAALLLILGWVTSAAPLYPGHLLSFYNPLAGGLARAVQTLPVGWGEGVPEASAYLAELPGAQDLTLATWSTAGVASVFPGCTVPLLEENLPAADYVLVYISDLQEENAAAGRYYGVRQPAQVVRVAGVPMVWVYRNDDAGLAEWLRGTVTHKTVVVSNTDTALARAYPDLPWAATPGGSARVCAPDTLSSDLQTVAFGADSVVYLRYPWQDAAGRELQQQLDQSALLVEMRAFALGVARRYVLLRGQPLSSISPQQAVDAAWQGGMRIESIGLSATAQYRQSVGVALRFVPAQVQPADWHVFVRVLDAHGREWGALDDRLLDRSGLATAAWEPGATYDCRLAVPLRAGIPWGEYRVVVGLYALDDLRRLSLVDVAGNPAGTELTLGTVQVGPALVPASEAELGEHTVVGADLNGMKLLGYHLDRSAYATGELADVTLFLRPQGQLAADTQVAFGWRDADSTIIWTPAQPVAGEGRRSEEWRSGELLAIHYLVPVPNDLVAGDHTLVLNLRIGADGAPVLAKDLALEPVPITEVARIYTPPTIQHAQSAMLGEAAQLLGYDLAAASIAPGEQLSLTIYWQALAPDARNLAVFVHLLDADGHVRGQVDSQPAAGSRPTSGWVKGEVIIDTYTVPFDADAPSGVYRVEIGLYDPATLTRLPATDANGQRWRNDAIVLESVVRAE